MAIYEYRCGSCGNEFELKRMMSEMDVPAPCPRCKGKSARLFSVFAASNTGVGIIPSAKQAFRAPAPVSAKKEQPAKKKAPAAPVAAKAAAATPKKRAK